MRKYIKWLNWLQTVSRQDSLSTGGLIFVQCIDCWYSTYLCLNLLITCDLHGSPALKYLNKTIQVALFCYEFEGSHHSLSVFAKVLSRRLLTKTIEARQCIMGMMWHSTSLGAHLKMFQPNSCWIWGDIGDLLCKNNSNRGRGTTIANASTNLNVCPLGGLQRSKLMHVAYNNLFVLGLSGCFFAPHTFTIFQGKGLI